MRGNIKTVWKWFPTHSRSSISNNNHHSKVTTSKLSLPSDPTKGCRRLPLNNHVDYQNLSWHTSSYNGMYPKTICCNPSLPWSQKTPPRKLVLFFQLGVSILWIIYLASWKPNPCPINFYYLTKPLKTWTTIIKHLVTTWCSTLIKSHDR